MRHRWGAWVRLAAAGVLAASACSAGGGDEVGLEPGGDRTPANAEAPVSDGGAAGAEPKAAPAAEPPTTAPPPGLPPPGNPDGRAAVPPEAQAVDTSRPDRVIGDGTPASCTSAAVVDAVAAG
ncbi:MAG TPA: hypothetical protein VFZ77_18935, partial [Acidimicrobiales bacterium]